MPPGCSLPSLSSIRRSRLIAFTLDPRLSIILDYSRLSTIIIGARKERARNNGSLALPLSLSLSDATIVNNKRFEQGHVRAMTRDAYRGT